MAILANLRWFPLALRSVLGTSMVTPGIFYRIGNPIEREGRIIKIDNLTDQHAFISLNGVDAFTIIPSGGFFVIDIATNDSNRNGLYCDALTQFWASTAVLPTTGSVYITTISSTS